MYLFTTKKGDTIANVARSTGTSEQEIYRLNGLESDKLTPGINLLVPGKPSTLVHHTVGPRETLTSIARLYGIPVTAVAGANALADNAQLERGQVLFVPMPIKTKRQIEVNGYLIPSGTSSDATTIAESGELSYCTIFSYHVNDRGGIVPLPDQQALNAAKSHGVSLLLSVTNFDGANFNTELAHTILASAALRNSVIAAIEDKLSTQGFSGVNIDFEHMQPSDRPLYNAFVTELRDRMHPQGYSVSIAMGPKTKDEPNAAWMGAFDYKTLGSVVDFIMLMTYEWGWVGGPPMAIAPINQVRAVLEYATSVIPAQKLLMGIPTYGYNWLIPDTPNNLATGISPLSAQNLAIEKGAAVRFDPMGASPMFHYWMGSQEHEIWFEDAKSIMAKFHLVYEMGLRGVSFWVLGQTFPQLWSLVTDSFTVKKL
ncbi:MAG: glycosyl hydrolase family 18 protein [Bacilli bacterium]